MKHFGAPVGTPPTSRKASAIARSVGSRIALAIGVCTVLCACDTTKLTDSAKARLNPPITGTALECAPGREGCPCETAGARAACGKTVRQYGDYVTCAMGQSFCQANQWGPCDSKTLVTKNFGSATRLGASGLRTLGLTARCSDPNQTYTDPCDPGCYVTLGSAADIDASMAEATGDGSVTIRGVGSGCADSGVGCQLATDCPLSSPTTLTGTVFDPAGLLPLYNALVYVPNASSLPPLTTGAFCDSCSVAAAPNAIAAAVTGADGKFVLTHVPSTDMAPGGPIPLVVQVGKWRREVTLTAVPKCRTTVVAADDSRLPRNHSDGYNMQADLPRMAIVSARYDATECLLLKMGIDPAEFQLPQSGKGRIDYYLADGPDFYNGSPPDPRNPVAPPLAALVGDPATLNGYDVVIVPCTGGPDENNNMFADNVAAFANGGGRLFASHYSYTWLATPHNGVASATNYSTMHANPFFGVATWNLNATNSGNVTVLASVDTTFTKGNAFATWLSNAGALGAPGPGASDAGASPQILVTQPRHDVDSMKPVATEWIRDNVAPNKPLFFSFDTPIGLPPTAPDAGSSGSSDAGVPACGRVMYSEFHASANDRVDVTTAGVCSSDAQCGVGSACELPASPGSCTPVDCSFDVDCKHGGYVCGGATLGNCTSQKACLNAADCSSGYCQNGICLTGSRCARDSDCLPTESCANGTPGACMGGCLSSSDCTAGELCVSGQCTGCRDGTFCPSGQCIGGGPGQCKVFVDAFPYSCRQGPMTSDEKALEFLFFDLTGCLSPASPVVPSPALPSSFDALTFTEAFASADFASANGTGCPAGTHVVWRQISWEATVPNSASLVMSLKTANRDADGSAPDWTKVQKVDLVNLQASTPLGGAVALLQNSAKVGAFDTAMPPLVSGDMLQLTVTLNPTFDHRAAPTLRSWQIQADCAASE